MQQNYWELRKIAETLVPRKNLLMKGRKQSHVREKGRKSRYHQYNLETKEMVPLQRLLDKTTYKSFLEISLRAAHCPMPLNADVWDGLVCTYHCRYCYANLFRASLYTSFFDNARDIGMRHCNPDYFKKELDNLLEGRGDGELKKAIEMRIPIRFGIRFEDFLPIEKKEKVSLSLLQYLKDNNYPVMINTKSDLVGDPVYVESLSGNGGKAAVHITMISSDESLLKKLEPAAPTFTKRIKAAKRLTEAGIRVVARIEPFMVFINDQKDQVDDYMGQLKEAGISHITLDTYSYSAASPGIRGSFESVGIDFSRMFLLMSDCQWLGSLLLSKFQNYLRENGFSCSTFDFGNVPSNSQDICCEVGDLFQGFSYGNMVSAIRFIQKKGKATWSEFESFVEKKGGFLSEKLRQTVHRAWNLDGNKAYVPSWGAGIVPIGICEKGDRIWLCNQEDFREEVLENFI